MTLRLSLIALLLSTLACGGAGRSDEATWLARRARPLASVEAGSDFADLAPVGDIVGDARLVLLGESRHDAREHFLLKARIVEYLVAEHGFTVFAMEESLPCAERINDWVLGGEGDLGDLMDTMSAWFIWNTGEVRALLAWMRAWNDDPAHAAKVSFHGLDVMDPLPAAAELTAGLPGVDPEAARLLNAIDLSPFSDFLWPNTQDNYRALTAGQRDALGAGFAALRDRLIRARDRHLARSTPEDYARRLRLADNMAQTHEMFSAMLGDDFRATGHVREAAMTANALRLIEEEHPGERAIVWAHNLHVGRDTFDLDIPGRPPTAGMIPCGRRLGARLGDDMVAIGFSFARGVGRQGELPAAPAGTVDGLCAAVGEPVFVVDLRDAPAWFRDRRVMRAEGGEVTLTPARAFDALLFVDAITPTAFNPGVAARFEAGR